MEADILREAAPHEISDFLMREGAASKPLCKLVDAKEGETPLTRQRKLVEKTALQSRLLVEGEPAHVGAPLLEKVSKTGACVDENRIIAEGGAQHLEHHASSGLRTLSFIVFIVAVGNVWRS